MRFMNKKGMQGFTLLELMLVLGIVGIITTFVISISSSIRNMSNVSETKNRMIEIAAKAKDYYRGHETLPDPGNLTSPPPYIVSNTFKSGQVPTQAAALDLEQKYRLDSWGQFLEYHMTTSAALTDIDGINTDGGKRVAGIIISYGPNQQQDYTGPPGAVIPIPFNNAGDDIIVPINVSKEATEIALEELKVLQDKVNAFDALYEGYNNDGDGQIDEDGCVNIDTGAYTGCPPAPTTSLTDGTTFNDDPNCGTATLDEMEDSVTPAIGYIDNLSTYCPANNNGVPGAGQAYEALKQIYTLGDSFDSDPWGNIYSWGFPATYGTSNQRYHKFFSAGPDGFAGTPDDIFP